MSLYLAIDAGGTKTQCLLADETRVLARASTGTVKLMRVPEAEATLRLRTMIEDAASQAGVSLSNITRTCIGLAGLTSPAARAWALHTIPALVSGELLLLGDEEIALDAAFPGSAGVLVIAGTGSNVIGRAASGIVFNAGGWGSILGDEGSGYWIGLEALRAALHAVDHDSDGLARATPTSGPAACLLAEAQQRWQLNSLAELISLANHRPSPDFAELAPVVVHCADSGDALASSILARAGHELAEQVLLIAHKVVAASAPALAAGAAPPLGVHSIADSPHWGGEDYRQPIGVAYTGSILANVPAVCHAMASRVLAALPHAHILPHPVDPLDGALYRARHG